MPPPISAYFVRASDARLGADFIRPALTTAVNLLAADNYLYTHTIPHNAIAITPIEDIRQKSPRKEGVH